MVPIRLLEFFLKALAVKVKNLQSTPASLPITHGSINMPQSNQSVSVASLQMQRNVYKIEFRL